MPFLAIYLEVGRNVPLSTIGIMYLASGFLTFLSQLVGGRLTDSIGPKRVMIAGYLASFIASIILGVMVQFRAIIVAILVLYPIFSLARGISQPATSSIIANQDPNQYRTGFSLLAIAGNLGFAIGPAIGGVLADIYSYAVVFVISALTALTTAIIAQINIHGGKFQNIRSVSASPRAERWLDWTPDRNLVTFLVLTMCAFIAIGYEITPLSLYVAGFLKFSNSEIGYLFATNGALIVVLQLPSVRLVKRFKRLLTPLALSAFLTFLSYTLASLSKTFVEMELVMVLVTLGEIFLTVPAQTIVSLFSKSNNAGTYQGYYSAFSSVGRSLATFLGPLSFQLFVLDPQIAWLLIAIFALAVGFGFLLLSPRMQQSYEENVSKPKNSTIS